MIHCYGVIVGKISCQQLTRKNIFWAGLGKMVFEENCTIKIKRTALK